MLLWSSLLPILTLVKATSTYDESFHESLTLHPLPDGRLSVLFEFTTLFSSTSSSRRSSTPVAQSHHSLTPPSLLLPLEHNRVSELTISFVSGRWDQRRTGEAGPLHHESGGGGGEVRGWLRNNQNGKPDFEAWTRVTHALGGLFCAGLGPSEDGDSVNTFGHIYPAHVSQTNTSHFFLPQPTLHLCTENLTPFLTLLPSKGLSGLSLLLARPDLVFAWGFQSEGIEVIMPSAESPQGRWRGWWEGIVDLVPPKGGDRSFSLNSLFKKNVPRAFPMADSSVLKVILPEQEGFRMNNVPSKTETKWIDGRLRNVANWDLSHGDMAGKDISFWWDGEGDFRHPRSFTPPTVTLFRTVIEPFASDGTFSILIHNTGDETRQAVYSEAWPWWLQAWTHEISIAQDKVPSPLLITSMFYEPSTPPTASITTLHLGITIPARSTLQLKIPFTKLTLKYTEHRPDAERGREIPSGMLTFLDLEDSDDCQVEVSVRKTSSDTLNRSRCSRREHLYTSRRLVDLPTPDFSMPYNVIIMTSTVMAVFFGLMHGALTRRWGYVDIEVELDETDGAVASNATKHTSSKVE
ncbi:GPI transamidase component PIG-T [Kockovaella imperatae]|uniref:GPI transamidase component PIG-T n=1 Tax=Kockovaella imperatae TaxID=4999 RepID=A0A1Y1ULB0_9TREE|nr:GPI transamidase component PIG-T [Kockovaella imperatae]ORX38276.1 GPI transamidase component PIG-T [Kockovaella imperatae]